MHGDHEAEDGPFLDRTFRFGRDVAINVVGNLITAAVLYLAAVLGGLLPKSRSLVLGAGAIVMMAFIGVFNSRSSRRARRSPRLAFLIDSSAAFGGGFVYWISTVAQIAVPVALAVYSGVFLGAHLWVSVLRKRRRSMR